MTASLIWMEEVSWVPRVLSFAFLIIGMKESSNEIAGAQPFLSSSACFEWTPMSSRARLRFGRTYRLFFSITLKHTISVSLNLHYLKRFLPFSSLLKTTTTFGNEHTATLDSRVIALHHAIDVDVFSSCPEHAGKRTDSDKRGHSVWRNNVRTKLLLRQSVLPLTSIPFAPACSRISITCLSLVLSSPV